MQCIERKRMSICYDSFNGVNDMYHYNNGISKINENILLEKKECVSFENKINKIKDYLTYQRGLEIDIKEMIYMIRGQQVMLDTDLARLYGYEVKKFNQQVKRNIERFPDDFMFQLTKEEKENLWSQNVTASISVMSRSLPYAFTEQGIYMLATVLKGDIAVNQSIIIMRTFKEIRHYINSHQQLFNSDLLAINHKIIKHEESINQIEKAIENEIATKADIDYIMDNFIVQDRVKEILFSNGEQFEADEFFINIYKQANQRIYIVDNYISIKTLSHLKHKKDNVEVIIFSENNGRKDKLRKIELEDFNRQYPFVELRHNRIAHDRYIIIDYDTKNEKVYHCGSSIKDSGKKICTINRLEDKMIIDLIVQKLLQEKSYELRK